MYRVRGLWVKVINVGVEGSGSLEIPKNYELLVEIMLKIYNYLMV